MKSVKNNGDKTMKKKQLFRCLKVISILILPIILVIFLSNARIAAVNDIEMAEKESQTLSQSTRSDMTAFQPKDGVYFIQNEFSKRFAYPSNNTSDGANILQYDLYYSNRIPFSRKWEFKKQSDGYYTIQNVTSQKYLGFSASASLSSSPLIKNYTEISDNTKWKMYKTSHEAIILVPKGSTSELYYVMSLSTGSYQNNTTLRLSVYTDNTDLHDEWSILPVDAADSFVSTIMNDTTGRFIRNDGNQSDTQVISGNSVSDSRYLWKFEYFGDLGGCPFYHVKNEETGLYLASPANFTEGTAIEQETYLSNSQRQLWRLRRSGEVYYLESRYQTYNNTSLHMALDSNNKLIQTTSSTNSTWDPRILTNNLCVYYDEAFAARHGNASEKIKGIFTTPAGSDENRSIYTAMKEYFGVQVIVTYWSNPSNYYESYPYTSNCLLKSSEYMSKRCTNDNLFSNHCTIELNSDESIVYNNCLNGLHHKCSNKMHDQLPSTPLQDSKYTVLLYTGHETCAINDGSHTNGVLGWGAANKARISVYNTLAENKIFASTTFHEMMHTLHGSHHYTSGEPKCLYGENRKATNVTEGLILCDDCRNKISGYRYLLYNQNK